MKIEEHVSLRRLTSLHVGGEARYVASCTTEDEIREALAFAAEQKLPFFVLGKGSNTLFSDAGYEGVILLMSDRTVTITGSTIWAGAGVFMRMLVTQALEKNLRGLEELAGIPGTVGGAVRGNAGTWQTEIKDVVQSIDVLKRGEGDTWEKVSLSPAECAFGYRDSIFKVHRDWIVLGATFQCHEGDATEGAALVAKDLHDRHLKQPYTAPSAGSVFKNPDKANKVFSGQLIEKAGLKGKTVGGAQISEKHGNFIINTGKATAADVLGLVRLAQNTVKEQFGVDLHPEIEIVE